jgi:hypothetical protein
MNYLKDVFCQSFYYDSLLKSGLFTTNKLTVFFLKPTLLVYLLVGLSNSVYYLPGRRGAGAAHPQVERAARDVPETPPPHKTRL